MSGPLDSHTGRVLAELQERGISSVPGVFSRNECRRHIESLEQLLEERLRRGEYCGNERYQVLYNYFQGRPDCFGLLYQDITDSILSRVIDRDYVLISPAARNRQVRERMTAGRPTSGIGWHVDSRTIGDPPRLLEPTVNYFALIALDDLERTNGATEYIPGSHLWYRRPEDRDAQHDAAVLEAEAGSIVYFDCALWHRVGEPSERSRWTIFNMFGPWFMKPYYRFHEMFTPAEMAAFPPKIRQLLHWDSLPPRDHNESTVTLRRVRDLIARPS